MPEIYVNRHAGSDDLIVTVQHDDGQLIQFRREHARPNYLHTYNVTSMYADMGHDSHDDRDLAVKFVARECNV